MASKARRRVFVLACAVAGLLVGAAWNPAAAETPLHCEKDRCILYSWCYAVTTNFGCNVVGGDVGCETYNCEAD